LCVCGSYSPANLRNNVSPDHIVTTHTILDLINPQGAENATEEESWRARIAVSMTKRGVKASRSARIVVTRTDSDDGDDDDDDGHDGGDNDKDDDDDYADDDDGDDEEEDDEDDDEDDEDDDDEDGKAIAMHPTSNQHTHFLTHTRR
jgi:phosphopantothenoylcysteine synthetase/decarboxylase